MNRLQSPGRRSRVPRHAQPHRGDRPREGDPPHLATPTRSTRPRRCAPRHAGRRSAAPPHPLLRRVLGLGLPRGRRVERAPGRRADRGAASAGRRILTRAREGAGGVSALGDLRRPASPPPPRARSSTRSRYRVFMLLARPRRAAGGLRPPPAVVGPAAGAGALSPRRLPRRPRASRSPTPPATSSPTAPGARPGGPVRLLPMPGYLGRRLQPGQLLLPATRTGASRATRWSPRSPTRRGASATATCSSARDRGAPLGGKIAEAHARLPVHADGADLRLELGRARRAAGRPDRQPRARGAGVRGVAGAAPPRADASGDDRRPARATRRRCWRRSRGSTATRRG